MSGNIHVRPRGERWAVARENGEDLLSSPSEADAVDAGREIALIEHSRLVIHGRYGQVRIDDPRQYSYRVRESATQ